MSARTSSTGNAGVKAHAQAHTFAVLEALGNDMLRDFPHLGVQGFDLEGTLEVWNKGSEHLYGYSAAEALGRSIFDLIFPADQRDHARASIRHAFETGNIIPPAEFQLLRRDGSPAQVFCCHVLSARDEQTPVMFSVALDVSPLKRAEEDRRVFEERLRKTQRLESLGILAGGIAHDFNNLLMGVLGNADLLLENAGLNSEIRECLENIRSAASRAAELSRQMLAFSGREQVSAKPVSLNGLITELSGLLESSVSPVVSLRYDLEGGLPPVDADPVHLKQIVMNLVLNATEAIVDRPGLITVRTGMLAATHQELSASFVDDHLPGGDYVALDVRDNGCGMDPETSSRMFDPFFSTKFTGRGLGLSVVLGLIRSHHGAIRVISLPGKGTDIRVLLPCSKTAAVVPPNPITDVSVAQGALLLVDDDPEVLALGKRILDRLGFTTSVARDGVEAVAEFQKAPHGFLAVVLDMMMPRMDGEETFYALREIRADIPVLFCSGYDQGGRLSRLTQEEHTGFLQKPYSKDALRGALARLIDS